MKRHPDKKLTLREAYEKHYDKSDLALDTHRLYLYVLNRWERFTHDPPIGEIDNETIAEFRQALIDFGRYSPATINSGWTHLRSLLRRMAKPETGNPRGLGIIDLVPYMKPLKGVHKPPRRVSQDDLSLAYIACDVAQFPQGAPIPPAEYWRALIVVCYFTGLRKSDLFALEFEQFNFGAAELHYTAQKTGKEMTLPLHPVVVEHVQRIWSNRQLLFDWLCVKGGDYTDRFRRIIRRSGVEHFTLHDIRRTAASEIERAAEKPGMGSVLLQHRPLDVTGVSYLNQFEELREAIEKMRVPLAFKHGPAKVDRQEIHRRKERERMMREAVWQSPCKPDPSDWKFTEDAFCFRGEWYTCAKGNQLRALRCLALADGPVDFSTMAEAIFGQNWRNRSTLRTTHGRVCAVISLIRDKLRRILYLSNEWNPVPCVHRGNAGGKKASSDTKWSLYLPSEREGRA